MTKESELAKMDARMKTIRAYMEMRAKKRREMSYKQAIKIFGQISYDLSLAMGMHATNIQRQQRGESIAYSEEQFGDICAAIKQEYQKL